MDLVQLLRIAAAILLIFFLPGFFLVQALFPRKYELDENEDMLYRIVLGIALSIVINILIGFVLGSVRIGDGGAFNAPNITLSILVVSALLFAAGWYRGAYPFLGRAAEPVPRLPIPKKNMERIKELMTDWKAYKKKIYQLEARMKAEGDPRKIARYEAKRQALLSRIKEIDTRIDYLSRIEGGETESEEVLERIQSLFREWREVKDRLSDIDIKIAISQRRGQSQKEASLWKEKERLLKRLDRLDSEIESLKAEIGGMR